MSPRLAQRTAARMIPAVNAVTKELHMSIGYPNKNLQTWRPNLLRTSSTLSPVMLLLGLALCGFPNI
jgi:hypothetical protein